VSAIQSNICKPIYLPPNRRGTCVTRRAWRPGELAAALRMICEAIERLGRSITVTVHLIPTRTGRAIECTVTVIPICSGPRCSPASGVQRLDILQFLGALLRVRLSIRIGIDQR